MCACICTHADTAVRYRIVNAYAHQSVAKRKKKKKKKKRTAVSGEERREGFGFTYQVCCFCSNVVRRLKALTSFNAS